MSTSSGTLSQVGLKELEASARELCKRTVEKGVSHSPRPVQLNGPGVIAQVNGLRHQEDVEVLFELGIGRPITEKCVGVCFVSTRTGEVVLRLYRLKGGYYSQYDHAAELESAAGAKYAVRWPARAGK